MRLTIPACYASRRVADRIVSVRLGPHSFDTDWPWWTVWSPLDEPLDATRPLDGTRPTLTWIDCEPLPPVPTSPDDSGG
jgi:hypothetical protein